MPVISTTTNNQFTKGVHYEYDRIKYHNPGKTHSALNG